jgi:hypothetical protein
MTSYQRVSTNYVILEKCEDWPFCVPAKITKLIGLRILLFLCPINLVTFTGTQSGEYKIYRAF